MLDRDWEEYRLIAEEEELLDELGEYDPAFDVEEVRLFLTEMRWLG